MPRPAPPTFTDRTIVVTGASDGIGAEIARQLAPEKPKLVLAARNEGRLNELAFRLRKAGAQVLVVPTDVSQPEHCQRLMQQASEHFGRIDVLINNAGVLMTGPLDGSGDAASIDTLLRVNLLGAILCTRAALPALKTARGQIVGIASLSGRLGAPDMAVYCASKAGLAGFLDALRLELDGTGVDITTVFPGMVSTELPAHALARAGDRAARAVRERGEPMSVEQCAERAIAGIRGRERDVMMSAGARVSAGLKGWWPSLVDRLVKRPAHAGTSAATSTATSTSQGK